jgi:16S rRNA (adenine1518-N6/adenine1519-N6)-dimethyltransferase
MNKRKKFGQHFLTSSSIAKFIVSESKITKNDLVYEVGTGKGILVPFLCKCAKHVTTIEIDKKLYDNAIRNFSKLPNLIIKNGDGFKNEPEFDIFVSNLPYSKSRVAIQWLLQKKFSRAMIMVQRDFAEKLLADSMKERHAISVLSQYGFDMKIMKKIKNTNFSPRPKVDSVILQITQNYMVTKELIETINKLFSYRRKTIQNIAKNFGITIKSNSRLEDMNNNEIIKLAKKISRV